jgi:hypothetical protein
MFRSICLMLATATVLLLAGKVNAVELEYGWQRPRPILPPDVMAPSDPLYLQECGACHFPYPAGFLPLRSWRALMGKLKDHFGEDAELDSETVAKLLRYLESHAADRAHEIGSRRVMQRLAPNSTPLRLTDTEYLRLRHRNVLPRFIVNNPKVNGFGDCSACHFRGEQGYFNEQLITIPGFNR